MRRAVFGVALIGVGCMAVTGLDGYDVVADGEDAAADASTLPPPNDGGAAEAAPRADAAADADAAPIDAGPCGKCPTGTARTLCVANACVETRRVFVTRRGFTSLFGGVAKADAECQTVATGAKLGGTWKAWFSVAGSTPRDRFAASTVPYRMLDGTQIASSSAVLLTIGKNITLEHVLDRDETNTPIVAPDEQEVWTGTDVNGSVGKGTCSGWTSADPGTTGTVGVVNKATVEWAAVYLQQCSRSTQHLYCFEQ